MAIRSLTARVLSVSTVWAVVALVVIGVVISALYRQGSERGFQDLLRAQLYNVINSISVDEKARSPGARSSATCAFPSLRRAGTGSSSRWRIRHAAADIDVARHGETADRQRRRGPLRHPLRAVLHHHGSVRKRGRGGRDEVVLDIQGHAARFRVAGNRDVLEADIDRFTRNLTIALSIFGLGGLGVNALTILFGLKPLDQVRRSLEKIRTGESERLDGAFPREIQPLANEVNALIDSNRRIVERARMQVGNLAHSLKTPIAVLLNEARVLEVPHGELVRAQADAMQTQVQSYLSRARIAAQRGSVLARTEAQPALERIMRVMRRLNPDKQFSLSINPPGLVLAMEQQDVEETVGNLLENAARYAHDRISLNVEPAPEDAREREPGRQWIVLQIDDDGPGLDPVRSRWR